MGYDSYNTSDDNPGAGGNSAPATSGATINRPTANEPSGKGQKSTNSASGGNAFGTDLRRWNPLSNFSSYTYSLTLYMLSPEAANYFANTGKLPPTQSDGVYVIVAQSGGIRNDSEPRGLTFDKSGAPGPGKEGLDYYIDDLTIETFLLFQDGQKTATQSTKFDFKVIEPLGYTFLTKLSNTCNYVNQNSVILADAGDSKPNLYQQHYMIGVRFYGYDVNGKILQSNEVPDAGQALNDNFALFERLFPLTGTKVSFTVSGRATVYSWECVLLPLQAAFGSKNGDITNQASFDGVTVGEMIGSAEESNNKSLIGWLNAVQVDKKEHKNQEKTVKYDIKWVKNQWFDATVIKNSVMITNQEYDSATSPMMKINNVQESTVKTSLKANTINTKTKTINFPAGISIVSAIDQIIVKSKYVVDTLMKEINHRIEAQTDNNSRGELYWYSIKPVTKIVGRDKIRKDWVYDITYEVVPYAVPYLKSQYVTARSRYYGPIKMYEYTLTGKNTEVINFEMTYNNAYYVITPSTTTVDEAAQNKVALSSATPRNPASSVDDNPTAGSRNSATQIAESVRANLYSIGDQALATIKILGDPDFLMDSIGTKIQSDTFSKFYGNNQSINPYGGQVFIEIVFKVAEDYKSDGTLDVDKDQTIAFYPVEQQKLLGNTGLIYKIKSVNSTFSKGKFEQTLDLYMVPPQELIIPTIEEQREQGKRDFRRLENEYAEEQRREWVNQNPRQAIRQIDNQYEDAPVQVPQQTKVKPTTPRAESANDDAQVVPGKPVEPDSSKDYNNTSLSVNERLKLAFPIGGDQSTSAINRFRQRLGIPVGGTGGGGGG